MTADEHREDEAATAAKARRDKAEQADPAVQTPRGVRRRPTRDTSQNKPSEKRGV